MADVFVSYSRRDGEFVRRLVDALAEKGKEAWVDVEGIRDAEVFPERLRAAIEESDGFLFVISPESVASGYCEQEVEHALELHKRIVPLLLRPVRDEEVPEGIRVRNWIPFTGGEGELEPGVGRVVDALETDLEWTRAHTRWLLKALEWDAEGREASFLLRGSELGAAEAWLAGEAGKEPEPTGLQREYVAASRVAASHRQRRLLGAAVAVTAVSLGLLVFALVSRSNAIAASETAKSQALAAESQTQLSVDPERSILLAMAAMHAKVTPEATFALRAALDASPIRYRLPDAGVQSCTKEDFSAPGVAFSPDGNQLAEGLCGGVVVLADARTGRVLRRLHVGTEALGGPVAYSADGREVAACCRRGRVVLVDAATGAVQAVGPRPNTQETTFAFSPTAPLLAVADTNGDIVLWDFRTGHRRTFFLEGQQPIDLSFSPDGKRLAATLVETTANTPGLVVLDVRTGRTLASSEVTSQAAAFSPNGRTIVASQIPYPGFIGRVVLLDARTLVAKRTLVSVFDVAPGPVAFSPDGTRVAYGYTDGTAGLVSVRGQRLASFLGQTASINQVGFNPDGTLVATASADGTTRVWETSSGPGRVIHADGRIDDVWASEGRMEVAGVHDGTVAVRTWTDHGGFVRAPLALTPPGDMGVPGFLSPDGRRVGVPGTDLIVWNLVRRRIAKVVLVGVAPPNDTPSFSDDGALIAWGVPSAQAVAGQAGGPGSDRAMFAVADVRTGNVRHLGWTTCAGGWSSQAFSQNEALVAAGDFCGRVRVWDVSTGGPVGRPFTIGGELSDLAFDPTERQVAVASWNGTVTVADAETGRVLGQLTGDTSGVTSVVYSPDGRYIATASLDRTVRIWDARTLRPLRVLTQALPVAGVRFTSDGRRLVTWDKANTIRVWAACPECEDAKALLALAATRVTRELTPQERRTFGVG
jgi:WD40 repeat protein